MAWPSDLARTKDWGTEIMTDSDLESQFDLTVNYIMAFMNGTTGHGHAGTSNDGKKIDGASLTGLANIIAGAGQIPVANLASVYPIGIVITLGVSTNPNTLFGFGTWTAIAGKVIVGINAGDAEFDTLDETGGAKTVTLTSAESGVPAHAHKNSDGYYDQETSITLSGGPSPINYHGGGASAHNTGTNTAANAASAHNNLQPYIVKYVWQRTA